MALEAVVQPMLFQTGQNEGIERAVLPPGQFSYLQNARFRKALRLGKRNGYAVVSSLDASGAPLGRGGYGRLACLGDQFCAVDDLFYRRDQTSPAWRRGLVGGGPTQLPGTRLLGRFPEFLPAPSLLPTPAQSDVDVGTGTQESSVGGVVVAFGYLWSCVTHYSENAAQWLIRVTAIDPATGLEIYCDELAPSAGATDRNNRLDASLLTTGDGTRVVLVYGSFSGPGVKDATRMRTLAGITASWTAEISVTCIQSAVAKPVASAGAQILLVFAVAAGTQYTLQLINPATGAVGTTINRTTATAPSYLSCFMHSSGRVWVGFTNAANMFINTHDAAFAFVATSVAWRGTFANAYGPIMFAESEQVGGVSTVCAVSDSTTGGGPELCSMRVSQSAVLDGIPQKQLNASALSQPFTLDGGRVFMWALPYSRATASMLGSQLGKAVLVRIPLGSEFVATAYQQRSWLPQAVVDCYDYDPAPAANADGTPLSLPVYCAGLGYVALHLPTMDSMVLNAVGLGIARLLRKPLLATVRHRSEGLRYAPTCVAPCQGREFVASGVAQWVDAAGVSEGGFLSPPCGGDSGVALAGGDLTPGAVYSWTVVFETIDARGNIERSAPSVPISGTLIAPDLTLPLTWFRCDFGSRQNVRAKVYRTLADGQTYHLVASIDVTPAQRTTGTFGFSDAYSDDAIAQNEVLYTLIGQELPTACFPACTFANVGGQRLWTGGGFKANRVRASKRFTSRIAPEFADDDAFDVYLPADCTGMAWLDAEVLFTQEGIYVVSGDGPDGSGVGFFNTTRLPFEIGCIDWRSVVATDAGVFFQSQRGLYLLPRGFGPPVAMDQVLDTLTAYPIITAARSSFAPRGGADTTEQVVQWCAVADEAATAGVVITYDIAYQAFSIDTCGADFPATFLAGWGGDPVQAPASTLVGPGGAGLWHPFRVRDAGFGDGGLAISMRGVSGDVRPWGPFGHGVMNRVGVLGELRSACTLQLRLTTDRGTGATRSRVYALAGGDTQVGEQSYVEAEFGNAETRDVTAVRVEFSESSTLEGFAPFGMFLEHQRENQGWRLLPARDRVQ